MDDVSGSTIIGVCGGSGSGKTTLARELARLLGPQHTVTISFDSYYHDLAHLSTAERAAVNFDAPESLDVDLLTDHLDTLRQGGEVAVPVYDFASHTRSTDLELIASPRYVVLEGILLFAFAEVRELIDYRVYLDCPTDIRFQRRLARDTQERGRSHESVTEQWDTTVAPMHELHVEPYAPHAHYLATYGPPAADVAITVVEQVVTFLGHDLDDRLEV